MSTWQPIDPHAGLWHWEKRIGDVAFLRAVAVMLDGEHLLIYSPVKESMPGSLRELKDIGEPTWLLAPNHFHNLGLDPYAQILPDARVASSDEARKRLDLKLRSPVEYLSKLAKDLPDHVRLLEPPGTRNGEVWLRVETAQGIAWVVGDAFMNLEEQPPGCLGRLLPLFGVVPGLIVGGSFKWIALYDRRLYGTWLRAQLAADRPVMLIPSHGRIERGPDLADRLQALVEARLPGG